MSSPSDEQWRHFNLRAKGFAFSRQQYEGWHTAYLNNKSLSDNSNPTSDAEIERALAVEPQPYSLDNVRSFSIALPRGAHEGGLSGLLDHLADVLEVEKVTNVATITLYEMFDHAGNDSPQLDVWLG